MAPNPLPIRPSKFQIDNQWLEFYEPALKYGAKISTNSIIGDSSINIEDSGLPFGSFGTLDFVGFTLLDNGNGTVSIQSTSPGTGIILQENGTPLSALPFVTLNFIGATLTDQGSGLSDITITPDGSTIDWSTVNWANFFADIDWTLNSWADFFTSFYSEINWTDFIDEIVANWTETNWNTFIDEFVDNVDEDDVFNFLDQIDADKGDILVNDGTNWNLLPVGTNGKILTANSTEANGIEWASPSGGVISGTGVSFPSVNETVAFGTVVDSMMFTDLQGARQQYENLPFQSVDSQIYIVYSSSSSSSLDSITINSDRSIVNINATATLGGVFATTGTASDWYYILSGTRLFAYLSTGGINAIKYIELSGNVDIDNNYSGAVATTITHPFTRIGNIHIREDGKWIVTSETSGGLFLTINICTYDGASTLTVDSSFTRTYNNGDASGFTTVDQTTGNVIMHIYDGTFEGSIFTLNSTATSLISKRVSDQQDLRRADAIVIGNRFYVDSNIDSTSGGNITKGLKVGTIINPNL